MIVKGGLIKTILYLTDDLFQPAPIAAATALLDRGFGKPREADCLQYSEPSIFDLDI